MVDGLHHVRIDRTLNKSAWRLARRAGEKKDAWLASLLIGWGGDFVPPPPPPPKVDTRDLTDVRLFLDDDTWERIKAKAKHEKTDVSSVLNTLLEERQL